MIDVSNCDECLSKLKDEVPVFLIFVDLHRIALFFALIWLEQGENYSVYERVN